MTRTPTQQRAWDDLLAVEQPRPVPDPTWVEPLRARLEDAALQASVDLPPDTTLRINKTALDHAGGFQLPVRDVVAHAWLETATDRGSAASFVAELGGVAADGLRGAVYALLATLARAPHAAGAAARRAARPR